MRRSMMLAIILAGTSGLFAATSIYSWMARQSELAKKRVVVQGPSIDLTTVVVAREDLAFGTSLMKDKLEEIQWPTQSVPQGAYRTVNAMFAQHSNRVVTQSIKTGEPILANKVTGPGQRASLSTMLAPGMKAISIKVNETVGVSGFVLPGDRVDVLLTRNIGDPRAQKDSEQLSYSNLLLPNIRVLAIDQTADPNHDAPKIVRNVTVEVSLRDAQKIALATEIGQLSIVLREGQSKVAAAAVQKVSVSDLNENNGDNGTQGAMIPASDVAQAPPPMPVQGTEAKITVVRPTETKEYTVPRKAAGD